MKPNRITKHQQIWKRTKNGLELSLPQKINTDIGFQLMFGYREDHRQEVKNEIENGERYTTRIYRDVNDFKNHI